MPLNPEYAEFCEWLWREWLADRLRISEDLANRFDLKAAPEPWLPLRPGSRPLVALTTNPGATLPIQRRKEILAGRSITGRRATYAVAAAAFAAFYTQSLTGPAAHRLQAMHELAALGGYDGLLQVECVPFHSSALPGKKNLPRKISADSLMTRYVETLRLALDHKIVVAVSAASSHGTLGPETVRRSPWLQWQAELLGITMTNADRVPLVRKGAKVTCVALTGNINGLPRALVLMMGGNHLPAQAGLRRLADALGGTANAPAG